MSSKNYSTTESCTVCGCYTEGGNALHHVKTRGAGGSDDSWNLMPLCTAHHNEVHMSGLKKFSKKHSSVHSWLSEREWEICPFLEKWTHQETKEGIAC